jgi:glycosyltransferase involved in cell wall biosynthesis
MGRKVLVCEFDIFRLFGGGQTVYQNIIRRCPNDTFYYFITSSEPEPDRPPNAIAVPFRPFYTVLANIPQAHEHFFHVFRETMDMARSLYEAVGEVALDVADTPDYRQIGLFLRRALEAHGISIGVVALALHGTLSSAFTLGWPWSDDPRRLFARLRLREHLQFRIVDARYAISEFYADEWHRYASYPINMLDPLAVIRQTQPTLAEHEDRAADLLFIGRRERRKGPDLFLDLAWWLPPETYRRAVLIGDEGVNHQDADSRAILDGVARRRRLSPQILPPIGQSELQQLIRRKSVVLVPSRYDQFNLVALEALLDGCPTLISRHAGVARFIEQRLPKLSWLLADIGCDRSAVAPARKILESYDETRSEIVDVLQGSQLAPDFDSLQRIYDPANKSDRKAQGAMHDLADRFEMFSLIRGTFKRESKNFQVAIQSNRTPAPVAGPIGIGSAPPPETQILQSDTIGPGPAGHGLRLRTAAHRAKRLGKASLQFASQTRDALRSPRETVRTLGKYLVDRDNINIFGLNGTAIRQVLRLKYASEISRNLVMFGERSNAEREGKLRYLNDLVSGRWLDRVRFFREMVRLERLRGNDLIAATYGLRLLRWIGGDRFHLLGFIQDTLRENGFVREAEAAQAMYGAPERAEQACRAFLDDQLQRHRSNPVRQLEMIEDRRTEKSYRVSIVVSLYNAADKLPTFWKMLSQQDVVQSGVAEVVFVDSGSPGDERAVFQKLSAEYPLPAVYARSKDRETIQAAWNRGINLASGDYLAFLGVDEGVHPECLRLLADELDRDASLDWVMADSIVTEVDKAGIYSRDVMSYDRTGYRHNWHYLDCTFLSYVGGLYRRSIHDRLGYYDETFRAAGDTEFKNRILPFIKTKYVPRVLGVFNNYPEERTTQHPRAEIEDLRAWYLHRTLAGVSYAFDNRPVQDVIDLLKDTLAYRKCYCQHISTDIDLADSLAAHLARRSNEAKWQDVHGDVRGVLQIFQRFEQLQYGDRVERDQIAFVRDYRKILSLSKNVARVLGSDRQPAFDVFHDNRYEQHWWTWDTWSN